MEITKKEDISSTNFSITPNSLKNPSKKASPKNNFKNKRKKHHDKYKINTALRPQEASEGIQTTSAGADSSNSHNSYSAANKDNDANFLSIHHW